MFLCIVAIPKVNLALNRPAWQSSVRCDRFGCHGAYRANDGSKFTKHNDPPGCAHGAVNELKPWYAIDLGVAIYVDAVDVTTRDCRACGGFSSPIKIYY